MQALSNAHASDVCGGIVGRAKANTLQNKPVEYRMGAIDAFDVAMHSYCCFLEI